MGTQTLPQYLGNNIPAVTIQFDDGLVSTYTKGFAYMQTKGIKASALIHSATVDTSGRVTVANLQEMNTAGWDIANHTTDNIVLTGMTEAQQETALNDCRVYLDGLGLTRASRHVTYPSGLYNADTLAAMAATGMLTGKVSSPSRERMGVYYANNPYLFPFIMPGVTSMPPSDLIDQIEASTKEKTLLMIVFHNILDAGATNPNYLTADFQTVIDWLYNNHVICLTISQVYSLLSGSIEYTNYWE